MYPPVIKRSGESTIYRRKKLLSIGDFPGPPLMENAASAKMLIGWHRQTDRAHAFHVAGGVKILDACGDGCRCTARVLQVVGAGHQNHLPRSDGQLDGTDEKSAGTRMNSEELQSTC